MTKYWFFLVMFDSHQVRCILLETKLLGQVLQMKDVKLLYFPIQTVFF